MVFEAMYLGEVPESDCGNNLGHFHAWKPAAKEIVLRTTAYKMSGILLLLSSTSFCILSDLF